MTIYKCPRCSYETNYITNFRNHLTRKKTCRAVSSNESAECILEALNTKQDDQKYACEYCNKAFSSSQGKYQHKKRCKAGEMKDMREEIDKLKEMIKDIQQSPLPHTMIACNTVNNTTIAGNTIAGNTINIETFGKENVEFLADSFIKRCLFRASDGVGDLTKKIHFNPDKPEYHNVTASNKKDSILEIFKNGKWLYADKNKVLDALIKQSFDIISSYYDQFEDEIRAELSPMNFKRVDHFVESVMNQERGVQTSLRKCLYLLILNNRHMVDKSVP